MHDLDENEFELLKFIFICSYLDAYDEYDATVDQVSWEAVTPQNEGWTLDKHDGGDLIKQTIRTLAAKRLIDDSGWRRRGEFDLYEIVWVVTDLTVDRYGARLRKAMN